MIGSVPARADDAAPHQEACPFTDRLSHWKDVNKSTIIVDMGVTHHYKVTFVGDCNESRYAMFAKVRSKPGICLSAGDTITFREPHHNFETVCVVQSVEQLPPNGM